MSESVRTHTFQAEVNQVLSLVINSLYSNKEIFLRELVSNASDAIDKLRFEALTSESIDAPSQFRIRLIPNEEAGTLTIEDNGIGMNEADLVEHLGTIAKSGTKAFMEKLKEAKTEGEPSLIGQFGVGFYSAYLVADHVEVLTRKAGEDEAWLWKSDAQETFTIESAERAEAGASITLHIKEEHRELLREWELRRLVRRYSDYVDHPIELQITREEGEDDDKKTVTSFEVVNQEGALWRRPAEEVTEEQRNEFYKHVTHDFANPAACNHFKLEGASLFHGMLFVPERPPFDLFDQDAEHGLRLYVKRVLIMEKCEELLPRWLRFVRGVVDSDDLPLNVSREMLQDSTETRRIRKQIVKKSLEMLSDVARNDAEKYETIWNHFGRVLKEGVHQEPKQKEKIAALLRYASSHGDGLTSLDEYIERMKDGQEHIYYVLGASQAMLESSPHLEKLKSRGYEVLYMTDGIDQWAVESLGEYNDRKLISAMSADLELGDEEEASDEKKEALNPFTAKVKEVLGDKVGEVKLSTRLADSPICLVIPKGGLHAHVERLLQANQYDMPMMKRIVEVNPNHPLIEKLSAMVSDESRADDMGRWIELLYDQALLTEGSPIADPARFAREMTALMQTAIDG